MNSAYVGSDHSLLLGKIRLKISRINITERTDKEVIFNIDTPSHDSFKGLKSQNRLKEQLERSEIVSQDEIEIR